MLPLATTRNEIRVVDDQLGTPTSAIDIAAAIKSVARNLVARPGDVVFAEYFARPLGRTDQLGGLRR